MSQTIIVTGASRGIGYETALQLARNRHQVIAVARTEERLKQLQQEVPDFIHAYPADLDDPEKVSSLTQWIGATFPSVDILVNNAGALVNKPFEKLSDEDWNKMLNLNLMTAVRLTRGLLSLFSDSAHIVNVSSMGGYQGSAKFPGLAAYSVAKGGLSILTECLAEEFSDRGIRVNALCLGAVQTEMLEKAFPGLEAPLSAEEMGTYLADFALNGSTYYNGKVLPVALQTP